jgi:hypothetical protein
MNKILFILISAALLSSCRSINPEAPEITVQTDFTATPQKKSVINIPIKIDLKPYFDETNDETPTVFRGSEQTCEGVSYKYKFVRDDIKFDGKGNTLDFSIDGKYSLWLNYCPECTELFSSGGNCIIPRIYTSCGVDEPMRKMYVSYSSEIGVTNDYKLESKTKLKKVKAKSPCRITVFEYNATKKVEDEIRGAMKDVEKDIDAGISSVDLRPEMEETWQLMSEPTDLEGYGFLYLNPRNVSVSKIRYVGDTAYFNAILEAYPKIYLDTQIQEDVPMPDLTQYKPSKGFDITMDISASYDSLSSIITQNVAGTRMEVKGKEIEFKNVEVHGAMNNQLSLKIDFDGKKKGSLYLVGTPTFNADSQHISFPDMEFDIKTKSALLKSAKWLFDKKITDFIRESSSMDLDPYLDTLKSTLNENLRMELTKGIFMNGEVDQVQINSIHPRETELFIRISSNGKLEVSM